MFERGKLSDEFLDSLLEELNLVKPKAEGEAQVHDMGPLRAKYYYSR